MPETAAPPIRVLLAEDDLPARAILVEVLQTLGYEVAGQVASGRDAVREVEATRPDVVLLDVHMPDGSGVEAATEIAARVPGTAVVLFTGDQTLSLTEQEIASTAAVSLLAKPAPPNTLDNALRLAVARARALTTAQHEAESARTQLESRKIIERAKGILMRRTGSSEQEAYRILQRTSQDRSVPMVTIAKAVLDSEPGLAAAGRR